MHIDDIEKHTLLTIVEGQLLMVASKHRTGPMTVNEARAAEGLPPLEGEQGLQLIASPALAPVWDYGLTWGFKLLDEKGVPPPGPLLKLTEETMRRRMHPGVPEWVPDACAAEVVSFTRARSARGKGFELVVMDEPTGRERMFVCVGIPGARTIEDKDWSLYSQWVEYFWPDFTGASFGAATGPCPLCHGATFRKDRHERVLRLADAEDCARVDFEMGIIPEDGTEGWGAYPDVRVSQRFEACQLCRGAGTCGVFGSYARRCDIVFGRRPPDVQASIEGPLVVDD